MKVNFIGGADTQRSLNHSDNRCINLVPSLNDKGDIAAFYNAPGLSFEVANPASEVGSGIYTASNGRCFEVAGTTLYELTESGGVISTTSRGTVTAADIYRMTDNGIEMLLVNGTDGWLFTFATNGLKKIKVASADFTVTIADPAVFTATAHGLVAGDPIRLTSTTGAILSDTVLEVLSPTSIPVTGYIVYGIKVAPSGDFAYALSFNSTTFPSFHIHGFTISADGVLSPLSFAPLDIKGTAPLIGYGINSRLAITSDGISAYALSNGNSVKTISLNASTGEATYVGQTQTYNGSLMSYSINRDVVISPDDAFVYVVNTSESTIYQFSRNLGTGELTALVPATAATGSGPNSMVISDDGLFAYVTNGTDNTVTLFSRNAVSGLLTSVSATSCDGVSPYGLALSPDTDNPYLYVVNKGSNEVEVFSRNSTTGVITHIASSSAATGTSPQDIIVTDESVYVTNYGSNTISSFIRSSTTGLLTAVDSVATGSTPFGIAITPTGSAVYVSNAGDSTISQYSRNSTASNVGLPTGLEELTTYYVIAAGLTADAFEVSETSGGTAVSTSGQQAGVHTFTTLGYGFPEGAKTCAYMNGRFIALEPSTQNFYVSEVLDGAYWDALNVQTVDSNPDYVVGEIVSHNELVVLCENSGEVFYDSGTTPTPFIRNSSGIFEVGCVAPYSIVSLDNQVYWLGGTKEGEGIVYKLQGFTPVRVSTHSIEYAIQGMSTISDARAFSYQQDGHHFYCLTFPTGDKTFVFDVNTGLWHERANFASGAFRRWEAQEHAYFAGKHLVLDYEEGKIYSISPTTYTYGTEDRKWLRSFRVPTETMDRTRHSKLQLDCEAGVGLTGGDEPTVMLKWSDDGGHTWSNEVWRSMGIGSTGEYNKRVIWHRLGMTKGQPRIYELSGTAAVKTVLLNVHLD